MKRRIDALHRLALVLGCFFFLNDGCLVVWLFPIGLVVGDSSIPKYCNFRSSNVHSNTYIDCILQHSSIPVIYSIFL